MINQSGMPVVRGMIRVYLIVGILVCHSATRAQSTRPAELLPPPPLMSLSAEQRRVYELLYQTRMQIPPQKPEEWIATLRELTQIGKPAVPAIVAELDRSNRDGQQRVLIMALRIIGDPRAVPGLIRAIPRVARVSSDYGFEVQNEELRTFLADHHWNGQGLQRRPRPNGSPMEISSFNRGITECIAALERITGHTEGHEPMTAQTGIVRDTPETQEAARSVREGFARRWQEWWDQRQENFVSNEEMARMREVVYDDDIVAAAGIARFGALFPTGPAVRLGPVRSIVVPSQGQGEADVRAFIDFDTGRLYRPQEGLIVAGRPEPSNWIRDAGVDGFASTGYSLDDPEMKVPICTLSVSEMRVWKIVDSRFDTFETEVRADKPLDLGDSGPSGNVRPRDGVYPVTFLFITREGGRGILQLEGSSPDGSATRLRYRQYEGVESTRPPLADRLEARRPAGSMTFGPVQEAVLATPGLLDRPSAIDLETGTVKPQVVAPADARMLPEKFTWLADWGGDAMSIISSTGPKPIGLVAPQGSLTRVVSPAAWDELSADGVAELLAAQEAREFQSMIVSSRQSPPVTWIVQTLQGGKAMVQIIRMDEESLTIRYKLVQAK